MNNLFSFYTCGSPACFFDKTPTLAIVSFEALAVVASIILLLLLARIKDKIWLRYGIVALGIFIFEFFTSPMWDNFHLGAWAYVYRDVSWILTVGWATMILTVIVLTDRIFSFLSEKKRFLLYLVFLTVLVFVFESLVVILGIRSYTPEVMAVLSGYYLWQAPIEGLYYIPVFMALVISFYRYWSLAIDKQPIVPVKKGKLIRNFLIALIGVFLFELMIEPMVVNANLPRWSYVYRDISFLMTGGWIIIIWFATTLVDRLLKHWPLVNKFIGYIAVAGVVTLPIEAYLMFAGFRVYGPSAVDNFSGFTFPVFNVPVEVVFAIPFYLALVIAFIRYWEIILDNKI